MLWLAMTTLEKLQLVPTRFWVNALLLIAAGVIALILVREAANMNKLVLGTIVFLLISTTGFQWIYERNEPRVLTPYINKIAPLFPQRTIYRN